MHQGNLIEEERPSTLACGWLMMRAVKNDQYHEENVDNVPEGPPDPPAPPDKPTNLQKEPPSIELDGERKLVVSSNDAHTSNEADALGVSGHIEDARTRPKNLWNVSERVSQRSEQGEEENSPDGTPECPYDLGGETAIPGNVHDVQEHPRVISSECADEMDTPCQDTRPEDPRGQLVALRAFGTAERLSMTLITMG